MKFNKEKYKSSGRKPTPGSESRPSKKQKVHDPSTFKEWVPAADPEDRQPISSAITGAEIIPGQPATKSPDLPPASAEPTQVGAQAPASSSRAAPPATILNSIGLAASRMEGVVTAADLAETQSMPTNKLARGIAYDLAKVMLFSSELGTRCLELTRSVSKEHQEKEELISKVSGLEAKVDQTYLKVRLCEEDLHRANLAREEALAFARNAQSTLEAERGLKEQAINLASERGRQLEDLRAQMRDGEAKAIEEFKKGDEAQDWLAGSFADGFEDAKSEILKVYPDLDLSSFSAFGAGAPSDSPPDGQTGEGQKQQEGRPEEGEDRSESTS